MRGERMRKARGGGGSRTKLTNEIKLTNEMKLTNEIKLTNEMKLNEASSPRMK